MQQNDEQKMSETLARVDERVRALAESVHAALRSQAEMGAEHQRAIVELTKVSALLQEQAAGFRREHEKEHAEIERRISSFGQMNIDQGVQHKAAMDLISRLEDRIEANALELQRQVGDDGDTLSHRIRTNTQKLEKAQVVWGVVTAIVAGMLVVARFGLDIAKWLFGR